MKFPIEQIESRLQRLIEGSLAAMFPWGGKHNPLARQLIHALRNSVYEIDGIRYVPGNYIFAVSSPQMGFWAAHSAELDGLGKLLAEAAHAAGYQFESEPSVILTEDSSLIGGETRITALPKEETGETAVMDVDREVRPGEDIPPNAFLIVNGVRVIPLRQSVINIGRREDNHIVTDDPRVSRAHAQLRAVHGIYHLFDLNSTGGTFINGTQITRAELKPGDVISLAGFPLIYSQDTVQDTPVPPDSGSLPPGSTNPYQPGRGSKE